MVELVGLMLLISILTIAPLTAPLFRELRGKQRAASISALIIALLAASFGLYWVAGAPEVALIIDLLRSRA